MSSEGVSAFSSIDVEDLGKMIHGSTGKEITSVMEINVPNRLSMVLVCGNTRIIGNIPKLYVGVATGSEKMQSFWMEFHCTDPLFVPLARHDQLSLRHSHEFKRKIVTRCSKDWFFRMQINSGDGHIMRFPCLVKDCIFILV